MKKLIVLPIIMRGFAPMLWAANGCQQHLSPTEFRAKQQTYITGKTELIKEEAAKFFPLYFELQGKKKKRDSKVWNLIRQGKDEKTTEVQYNTIMEGAYDAHIAPDRLDRTYLVRFRKILSVKKLYLMQKAEMRFHRELLKGMRRSDNKGRAPKRQSDKR